MTARPTDSWRQAIAEEARQLAAGELDPECAGASESYPEPMLADTDEALLTFEADLSALAKPTDEAVLDVIKHVVLALNKVNAHHEGAYQTDVREALCMYIDRTLVHAGIDVAALATRRGLHRHEITDRWRTW